MSDRYKTDTGKLKAVCHKAIKWYCVDQGLKPLAASAYPNFYFKSRNGSEIQVSIVVIMDAYDEFRKRTHGKTKAA